MDIFNWKFSWRVDLKNNLVRHYFMMYSHLFNHLALNDQIHIQQWFEKLGATSGNWLNGGKVNLSENHFSMPD